MLITVSTLLASLLSSSALVLHHSVLLASSYHIKGPAISSAKRDIIILHGLLGSARNFNTFARLLHQKLGCTQNIIAMDMRHHGRTHANEGNLSDKYNTALTKLEYSLMAEDINDTLDYLGIDVAHIVGHSMGGKTAAVFALTKPERVQSLAVLDISPVEYNYKDFENVSNLIQQLYAMQIEKQTFSSRNEAQAYIFSRIDQTYSNLIQFIMSNLQMTTGLGTNEWKFNLNMIVESLGTLLEFPSPDSLTTKYSGPLLLIKASNSSFVLSKHLKSIEKMFSQFSIVSMRDCGHWLHAEKPDELADILVKYITNCEHSNSSYNSM